MRAHYILSEYLDQAMAQAEYDKLEDNSFSGRIPPCKGVLAFSSTLRGCEDELRSTLEDWLLLGLKLGHVGVAYSFVACALLVLTARFPAPSTNL